MSKQKINLDSEPVFTYTVSVKIKIKMYFSNSKIQLCYVFYVLFNVVIR
jgi:hypothetical protein